jgi:hypothetical protein
MRFILLHLFAILVRAIMTNIISVISTVNGLLYPMSMSKVINVSTIMEVNPSITQVTIFPTFVT